VRGTRRAADAAQAELRRQRSRARRPPGSWRRRARREMLAAARCLRLSRGRVGPRAVKSFPRPPPRVCFVWRITGMRRDHRPRLGRTPRSCSAGCRS
jgi:hypothetical protein